MLTTTLYKLTNLHSQTRSATQWGENVTHELPVRDIYQLCSKQVLHAYASPELAVLMDPIQASLLPHAILWEAEGDVVVNDGTKVGCTRLTTLKQIPIPTITPEQQVTFAIKCALHAYKEPSWVAWAQAWLANTNRDAAAADAAYAAAVAAAADAAAVYAYAYAAATYTAADAATYATYTAYTAADAAAYAAAYAAHTARAAAHAAAHAADAAVYAADAAAHAADAAYTADFTFVALIAKEVCNV